MESFNEISRSLQGASLALRVLVVFIIEGAAALLIWSVLFRSVQDPVSSNVGDDDKVHGTTHGQNSPIYNIHGGTVVNQTAPHATTVTGGSNTQIFNGPSAEEISKSILEQLKTQGFQSPPRLDILRLDKAYPIGWKVFFLNRGGSGPIQLIDTKRWPELDADLLKATTKIEGGRVLLHLPNFTLPNNNFRINGFIGSFPTKRAGVFHILTVPAARIVVEIVEVGDEGVVAILGLSVNEMEELRKKGHDAILDFYDRHPERRRELEMEFEGIEEVAKTRAGKRLE